MFIEIKGDLINLSQVTCITKGDDFNHFKGYNEHTICFGYVNNKERIYYLSESERDMIFNKIKQIKDKEEK